MGSSSPPPVQKKQFLGGVGREAGGGGVWKFVYLHNRVFSPFHHDVNKLYNQISDVF